MLVDTGQIQNHWNFNKFLFHFFAMDEWISSVIKEVSSLVKTTNSITRKELDLPFHLTTNEELKTSLSNGLEKMVSLNRNLLQEIPKLYQNSDEKGSSASAITQTGMDIYENEFGQVIDIFDCALERMVRIPNVFPFFSPFPKEYLTSQLCTGLGAGLFPWIWQWKHKWGVW